MQSRQQAVSQPASLVESATSTVSSAIPIETVSVPRSRLGKTEHGGVCLNNLTGIKTSSISAIVERDCDISHLKIGLLNVISLTSKAVIVNELITDHKLDVIGLTETWLKPDEFIVLNEAYLLGMLVTISPAHPTKAEVLLTITIAHFNLQKNNNCVFIF